VEGTFQAGVASGKKKRWECPGKPRGAFVSKKIDRTGVGRSLWMGSREANRPRGTIAKISSTSPRPRSPSLGAMNQGELCMLRSPEIWGGLPVVLDFKRVLNSKTNYL
jgi:hypothetical protein